MAPRRIGIAFVVFALLLPVGIAAQKGGHSSSRSSSSRSSNSSSRSSTSTRTRTPSSRPKATSKKRSSPIVPKESSVAVRGSNGKIKRSPAAREEFMKQSGFPKGRKGYVVDHIVPLECGGADTPANMQWQTGAQAKLKDRSERNCRRE
jgi:hypothetical protein